MISLGMLTLNGYRSGVFDILIGSLRHIGWRIVERQAIWREGVLILNLYIMGAAGVEFLTFLLGVYATLGGV